MADTKVYGIVGGLNSIGSGITGGTSGSMLFVDALSQLGQDNANIFWDDTNNRLGIGEDTPLSKLHINGGTGSLATGLCFGDGNTGIYELTDNTLRMELGGASSFTFQSTRMSTLNAGVFSTSASSDTTPIFIPTSAVLNSGVGGASGSVSLITDGTNALFVDMSQQVGIGEDTPLSKLHINGGVGSLATGLCFGDGNTGIYELIDNTLRMELGGASSFTFQPTRLVTLNAGVFSTSASSDTTPIFIPTSAVLNSGLGGTSGSVSLITDGTNALFVDMSQQVGIGTTGPSTALHVDSNAADTVAILTLENTARNIQYFLGSGSPEGVQTGSIGDDYTDTVNGIKYIKNSGTATNTGWIALAESSTNLAEMILHNNSTETTIDSDDKQHALRLYSTGDLDDWTFDAGSTGAITDTANNSGTLRITDVGHGLITGDIVTITGLATDAQNDVTTVTRIDDDTFDCDDITFVTIDETGTWNQGSSLIAGALAAGKYLAQFGISAKSASVTPEITYHIYVNTTQQVGDAIQIDLKTSASRGFMAQFVTIVAGDVVWLAAIETGNNINITNIFSNFNLHRL